METAAPLTADDFTTVYDESHTFPFIEDENANGVYGFGHTDRAEFAAAVNEYDRYSSGDDDLIPYAAEDVRRGYAVAMSDERFRFVTADVDGAVPITYVLR